MRRKESIRLFDLQDRHVTAEQARRYALFEMLHTAVASVRRCFFIIGRVLFFFDTTQTAATMCVVIGSVLL